MKKIPRLIELVFLAFSAIRCVPNSGYIGGARAFSFHNAGWVPGLASLGSAFAEEPPAPVTLATRYTVGC